MVYMHFPHQLTEEEEMLQKRFAKLRKKKKALAALRAPKPEPQAPENTPQSKKRSSEAAADATEQAKKLIKLGAIKVESDKKDSMNFKRTKRLKDGEKPAVGFQPFSPTHTSDEEKPEGLPPSRMGGGRGKALYESFVSARESRYDREREERRPDREPPSKGNTLYIRGVGITEDVARKAFSNFGTIINITMKTDRNCCFVTLEKMESAEQAISQMNGSMVSDIKLDVSLAMRQPTFDSIPDASSASWASIAASQSQKGEHKDQRELVSYTDDVF